MCCVVVLASLRSPGLQDDRTSYDLMLNEVMP